MAIGEGTILNLECMVAAAERVEIGAHCMFANHCFVTDADHRFDDPDLPITWQGIHPARPGARSATTAGSARTAW